MTKDRSGLDHYRVVILGAGSLGLVYAGYLARAGAQVQVLCRDAHAQAIAARGGVTVEAFGQTWTASVRATADPSAIQPGEIVIVLAKTPQTRQLLEQARHLADDVRLAVSLQNGLEKNAELARWCGAAAVVGGVSMVGGLLVAPGATRHTFAGPTVLGELGGGGSQRITQLVEVLEHAGLPAVVAADIRSVEWSKTVQVLPAMSVSALTRRYYHEVLTTPELCSVFLQLLRETAAVARADGAKVEDWPAMLPVGTLSTAPPAEAAARLVEFGEELVGRGATSAKPSMLQSAELLRRMEVQEIQGYVWRTAERLGVDVPGVELCYRLLAGMDRHYA